MVCYEKSLCTSCRHMGDGSMIILFLNLDPKWRQWSASLPCRCTCEGRGLLPVQYGAGESLIQSWHFGEDTYVTSARNWTKIPRASGPNFLLFWTLLRDFANWEFVFLEREKTFGIIWLLCPASRTFFSLHLIAERYWIVGRLCLREPKTMGTVHSNSNAFKIL